MRLGYARISTSDQCLDLQTDALKAAGCEAIFTDDGISGVATRRPGLMNALDHIVPGDVLVTWRFDRLARSLHDLMDITATLHLKDAGLVSLTEQVDTSSPSGRLILHIFGAVAEFERNLIIERTKAGLEAAKARGVQIGRKRCLTEADIVDAMVMLSRGETVPEIAALLNVGASTLYRYLAEVSSIGT